MVSSTSALLTLSATPSSDSPPSGSSEAGRETDNTPSFASRLDQQLSRPRPDNAARRVQPRRSASRPDAPEARQTDDVSRSPAEPTPETAPDAANTETFGDDSGSDNDKKEPKSQSGPATIPNTVATPNTAAALLTPDALNLPTLPVTPPIAPAGTITLHQTAPDVTSVGTLGVPHSGATIGIPTGFASAVSLVPNAANVTSAAPTTSPITPTVAMDSRAVVPNAAPGVANAPLLTSALLSASTANANLAATLAGVTPNTSDATVPTNGIALPANLPADITANNSSDANQAIITLTAAVGASQPSETSFSNVTSVSVAPAATATNAATVPANTAITGVNTANVVNTKAESQVTLPTEPSSANSATLSPPSGEQATGEPESVAAVSTGKQNLGSIERLLTLNQAKTASPSAQPVAVSTEPNVPSSGDAVPVTLPLRSNTATSKTMALGQGKPTIAGTAQTGTNVPTTGANGEPNAAPLALSSLNPDGTANVGMNAFGLHIAANIAEKNPPDTLPGSHFAGTSATGAESGLTSLARAATSGGSEGGEQGKGEAEAFPNEIGASAESRVATPNGTAPSASFAVANASGDAPPVASSTSATSSSPIDRAHVMEQVTRHLETMRLTGEGGEMRLRLNPHNLGSVQVSISTHQDGVVARIAVESAQVQQVMEGAKEHLRAGLEARGLHVQSVEVTLTPGMSGDQAAAFSGQRNRQFAEAQEGLTGTANYGRRSASQAQAAPLAAPATLPSRSLLADARLDCRA